MGDVLRSCALNRWLAKRWAASLLREKKVYAVWEFSATCQCGTTLRVVKCDAVRPSVSRGNPPSQCLRGESCSSWYCSVTSHSFIANTESAYGCSLRMKYASAYAGTCVTTVVSCLFACQWAK